MAELLLYAKNTAQNDFDPPLGAIIAARADGFNWGINESIESWIAAGNLAADFPDDFVLLKLPNVSHLGKVKEYVENHMEYNVVTDSTTAQYKWRIPVNLLPNDLLNELVTNRAASRNYTITQIKTYVQNKITGLFEA